ncbi:MAG: prephenate dehydratase domain-containing protein [Chloracidobacterium sp.]
MPNLTVSCLLCHRRDLIVIRESVSQMDAPLRVAFQGEYGAYGEMAAARFGIPVPCPTFARVCAAVVEREANLGVLPIENVIAGPVPEAQALLRTQPLSVETTFWLPIEHCLLGLPGASLSAATHVLSHWQALRQCAQFLARQTRLRPTAVYDTAGAAKLVRTLGRHNLLAIASRRAAAHYHLDIVAENIADRTDNATCFALFRA